MSLHEDVKRAAYEAFISQNVMEGVDWDLVADAVLAVPKLASAAAERDAVGLGCFDCGLLYGGHGWCDTHVPSDVWTKISPTGNEGGILCLTCMARRIEALGLDDVPLMVTSGPWTHEPTSTYQKGWHTGHKVAAAENAELRSRLDEVERLFADGPDTPCRTTWRESDVYPFATEVECVEVPMEDLRAVLAPAHDEGSERR